MDSSKQCMYLLSVPLSDTCIVSVSTPGEGQPVTLVVHTTIGGGESHDPEPSAGEISIVISSVQVTILTIRIALAPGFP